MELLFSVIQIALSVGLILFSIIGSRLSTVRSARNLGRIGQAVLAAGVLFVLAAVQPELSGWLFASGMFIVGAGFGLLASQLGNVNMSAVGENDTSEVGGLQGTFQNLGSSFGTAVVGSVFILMLTGGFGSAVLASASIPEDVQQRVVAATNAGAPIVSQRQAEEALMDAGVAEDVAADVAQTYADTQVESLRQSLFLVFALTVIGLLLSRGLPATVAPRRDEVSAAP
jgi:MFS family permease